LTTTLNGCLTVPDIAHPIGIAQRCQATRNSFVQALGGDFDGMLDASMSRQVTLQVRTATH
jgi:hypothetical protein